MKSTAHLCVLLQLLVESVRLHDVLDVGRRVHSCHSNPHFSLKKRLHSGETTRTFDGDHGVSHCSSVLVHVLSVDSCDFGDRLRQETLLEGCLVLQSPLGKLILVKKNHSWKE